MSNLEPSLDPPEDPVIRQCPECEEAMSEVDDGAQCPACGWVVIDF